MPADPKLTETGIRMEIIFEEIFFNELLEVNELQVIWWQHFTPTMRKKINALQKLRNRNLKAGLILNNISSAEDFVGSDEEKENEEQKQKVALAIGTTSMVKGMYKKFGLKPKTEEEGRWTKLELFDWDY
ncbi:hypothetical protein Plec18170_008981 [Paecilomyces lecythidis]